MVQRSEVFGLPAVKIGTRRGDDGGGIDGVELFRTSRIEQLRAGLRDLSTDERATRLRRIAVACLRAPTPAAQTATLLRDMAEQMTGLLPPAFRDRVLQRAHELSRPASLAGDPEEEEQILAAIHGIRAVKGSFEDDGPARARKALHRLGAVLTTEESGLLRQCADWTDAEAPAWLERVKVAKEALLDRLLVPPPARKVDTDQATRSLLIDVIDALETTLARSTSGQDGVLSEYLSDLQHDPEAVRAAIEHYTVVLAATCQQAAGGAMRAVRGMESGWPSSRR